MSYYLLSLFGYEHYAHIAKENINKLDAKYQKCYFIGYGVDVLVYMLWNADNHKVSNSRDVIFN